MNAKDITPPVSVERLLALVKLVFLFDESWESCGEWLRWNQPDYPFGASFFVVSPRSRRETFSPVRVYASSSRVKMTLSFIDGSSRSQTILTRGEWGRDPDATALRLLEELFKRYMQGHRDE